MVWQFVSGHVEGVLELIVVHIVVTICVNLKKNIRNKPSDLYLKYNPLTSSQLCSNRSSNSKSDIVRERTEPFQSKKPGGPPP